jgi:hypothetical protein
MTTGPDNRRTTPLDRADAWAVRNPWLWAVVGGLIALLVGVNVFDLVGAGSRAGADWFVVVGWSMSRGPGWRRFDRQRVRADLSLVARPELLGLLRRV